MKTQKTIWLAVVILLAIGINASAGMIDLTSGGDGTIGGAYFRSELFDTSTGTGLFEPFLRVQTGSDGPEKGYNTEGDLESPPFDTKSGKWTHAIQLGDVPEVSPGVYEFRLDINESGSGETPILSIDKIEIYLADEPDLSGYPALGTLVYDLDASEDNHILLNYDLYPGSGNGDLVAEIPIQGSKDKWLYFYTEMGTTVPANDGFEEWGVIIPEPATMLILGLGSVLLRKRK